MQSTPPKKNTLSNKFRWFLVNPQSFHNRFFKLIRRANEVLHKEGLTPFVLAIFRKIAYFFGFRPQTLNVENAIKSISKNKKAAKKASSLYDVILFPIIDWDFRKQRPQHLAIQFARKGHRVFYISTTFQDIPNPLVWEISDNIYGVVLPGPRELTIYSDTISSDQLKRFLKSFKTFQKNLQITEAVSLVDLPFWEPLASQLRNDYGWKVVYDCMDYHAGFNETTADMLSHETKLSQISDLVLVTSEILYNQQRPLNPQTVLIPNACEYHHFHQPGETAPPLALDRNKPIVGYFGAIAEWFDAELVAQIATIKPDWEFVLIGNTTGADLAPFASCPNIHLLGEKPYAELPAYLHQFNVSIIPFKKTPLTDATNPVKLFEFLSAGKPVVASNLHEIARYQPMVDLAASPNQWIERIAHWIENDTASQKEDRFAFAASNSWEQRFEVLDQEINKLFPLVSILIITYNNVDYTRLCLDSIDKKTSYPNFEVIVVDNNSMDSTIEFLQAYQTSHPNARVVFNEKNRGFAAANNQAALLANGQILVFLNNDTIVTDGWLSKLVEYCVQPEIGMVGPTTNWSGNESRIEVPYKSIKQMEEFAKNYVKKHSDQGFEIPMLAFFCVAIRKELWDELGPLDEQFGIGMFEDDDYAMRVKQKGLRIYCAKDIFVHHWGRASFSKLNERVYDSTFLRNKDLFEKKWNVVWEPPKDSSDSSVK